MRRTDWGRIGCALALLVLPSLACDDGNPTTTDGTSAGQTQGSEDTDGDGDGDGGVPSGCEAGKVSASGDIDGVGREFAGASSGRVLVQVGDPATLDLVGAGDIGFHFEWSSGPQPNGTPFDVTGTMSIEGTEHCFAGTLSLDADGFDQFMIADFAQKDGESCATPVEGSLTGCADAG